jgi:hypothetical protein
MASAALTSQPNVRSEPVDEPVVAAARVRPTQSNDVAEHELDDCLISGRHCS